MRNWDGKAPRNFPMTDGACFGTIVQSGKGNDLDRIANILASQLQRCEREALKNAALGRVALPSRITEDLRRLRLIDPQHAGLTPLGRDVWRVMR